MKSKTKIEMQLERKTNPSLVKTVILAKKNPMWIRVAEVLTGPNRNRKSFNLENLEKSEGKILAVCGKVLSQGEISRKRKVVALGFSKKAKKKLEEAGCEVLLLMEEIQKNKDAKGVKILK